MDEGRIGDVLGEGRLTPSDSLTAKQGADLFPKADRARRAAHLIFRGGENMDANIDSLTGLPNRRQFAKALIEATRAAAKPAGGEPREEPGRAIGGAVILLGIDNFGYVNEAHGHDTGDRILSAYGDALSAHLAARNLLARADGDEFAVLARDISTETDAIALAEDLDCVIASTGI
jgi:diguanylate cyclase (GGDEF)-like protein